ncbi:hypothetical protein LOK49_Contig3G00026, partial [Camellia lanceoleosa]
MLHVNISSASSDLPHSGLAIPAPLQRRGRLPRMLVLAPTRELARQVEKEIKESASYLNTVCVDVVVGTPGRIIDLINSGSLKLGEVQYLVLDEADQMLAVGFEEDVEVILEKLPAKRQSMLFLSNYACLDEKLAEGIKLFAISTTSTSKRTILSDRIMVYAKGGKAIVFTQTKRDADEVSIKLTSSIPSEALHGDISQHQRERTLNGFRQGKFTVLVATDVAARGLDIPNVDLIIHYELPNDPETFVHCSGRTGRAGKEGTAILMFASSQRRTIRSLERDVGCKFEFISPPSVEEVLESSAEQAVATLSGVHPESVEFFTPTAQKLIEEQGTGALAAAIAQLSGFFSTSIIPLTRDPSYTRGFLSARFVTGFLSDVYMAPAEVKREGDDYDIPNEADDIRLMNESQAEPDHGCEAGRRGRVNIWQRGLENSKSGDSDGDYGVDVWDHAMMGHKNSIRISILNLHFYLTFFSTNLDSSGLTGMSAKTHSEGGGHQTLIGEAGPGELKVTTLKYGSTRAL